MNLNFSDQSRFFAGESTSDLGFFEPECSLLEVIME